MFSLSSSESDASSVSSLPAKKVHAFYGALVLRQFLHFKYYLPTPQKKRVVKKKGPPKVKLSLADAIDLTGAKSVARQTHDALSATHKEAANEQIEKTMKNKMNRHETYL